MMKLLAAIAGVGLAASAAIAEDENEYGLEVGAEAPEVIVEDVEGEEVELHGYYAQGPTILIFYRGGWCKYCNESLAEWDEYQAQVESAGAQLVFLTPEKAEYIEETAEQGEYWFSIYSDPAFAASDAFKLRFSLDEKTKKLYGKYGIDLGKNNASGEWDLPVPATYIIDNEGVIRYAYVNEDYRVRVAPDEVLEALAELE